MHIWTRPIAVAGVLLGATLVARCTAPSDPDAGAASSGAPAASAAAPASAEMTAVVSTRELMANLIDPMADNIFEAVGVEVTERGTVETKPETDEDWARIDQGAIVLAEASNLLKIPRKAAPDHDYVSKNPGELPPAEIDANIEQNRAAWNAYANALRVEALKVRDIVAARETDKLFQAGSDIDRACENCHIAFWYPNERPLVEKNRNSTVFQEPPQAP